MEVTKKRSDSIKSKKLITVVNMEEDNVVTDECCGLIIRLAQDGIEGKGEKGLKLSLKENCDIWIERRGEGRGERGEGMNGEGTTEDGIV